MEGVRGVGVFLGNWPEVAGQENLCLIAMELVWLWRIPDGISHHYDSIIFPDYPCCNTSSFSS